MDWLRSCYRSTWNLPGAGEVNGRYFWSAESAPPYPDWNYIHSRNWHKGDGTPWPEFGETEDASQAWLDGALGQIFPNAVNVGDGSCIGSDLVGPITSAPEGLAQGVDRRCYSIALPQETHTCSFFDPSPAFWVALFDWRVCEVVFQWWNIPGSPMLFGLPANCRWSAQYGTFGFTSATVRLFRHSDGNWFFGLGGLPLPTQGAFRYIAAVPWAPFGPNEFTLFHNAAGIPNLPAAVTVVAGV